MLAKAELAAARSPNITKMVRIVSSFTSWLSLSIAAIKRKHAFTFVMPPERSGLFDIVTAHTLRRPLGHKPPWPREGSPKDPGETR